MANNEVAAGDTITARRANVVTTGTTAPSDPQTGDLWVDTTTDDGIVYVYTSVATWVPVSGTDGRIFFYDRW